MKQGAISYTIYDHVEVDFVLNLWHENELAQFNEMCFFRAQYNWPFYKLWLKSYNTLSTIIKSDKKVT